MKQPLIIITGASSGFGEATARLFSKDGYPLLLLARRLERVKSLGLPNTMCKQVDVNDLEAFAAAVREAESKYGPTDCIVNNAGVMLLGGMDQQDPNEWHSMLNTNVMGVMHGIHTVLEGMIQRRRGTIINVSSVAGRKTFPNHAAYCATKFAVHALSENLREELASKDIRVSVIAPGAAETELLSHTTSKEIIAGYESWKEDMGGVMSAQDVARSIKFVYDQPQSVCIREVVLASTRQEP